MKRHINWTSYEEAIFSTFPVEFHLDDVFEILLIIPGTNLDDCHQFTSGINVGTLWLILETALPNLNSKRAP